MHAGDVVESCRCFGPAQARKRTTPLVRCNFCAKVRGEFANRCAGGALDHPPPANSLGLTPFTLGDPQSQRRAAPQPASVSKPIQPPLVMTWTLEITEPHSGELGEAIDHADHSFAMEEYS